MAEFRLVQHAVQSPTSCIFCGDFAGPFIDAQVEIPEYGMVYVCAANERRSGCLTQMGQLAGMASAIEKQDLYDEMNSLEQEVTELEHAVQKFETLKASLTVVDGYRKVLEVEEGAKA